MNIIQTSRYWNEGVYISGLFEKFLKTEGHNVVTIANDINNIPDMPIDLVFGWGASSTLTYIRDYLNVPALIFDLGMIERTETPRTKEGYFRCGVGTEKWLNVSKKNDDSRWKMLNIAFADKKYEKGDIAVMGQVPCDVSHGMGCDCLVDWTVNLIDKIRSKTDTRIIYKFHPYAVDTEMSKKLIPSLTNRKVIVDQTTTRIETCDLSKKYKGAFSYCSTSLIHFIINGIPVVASKKSMFPELVSDITSDFDINFIPDINIKREWFNALAFSQWNNTEISNGIMWNNLKQYLDF